MDGRGTKGDEGREPPHEPKVRFNLPGDKFTKLNHGILYGWGIMGTLPVMYGRIISIMQDPRRPPARMDMYIACGVRY